MTEWISGVNIPSCQLMIGMGVHLDRMPDICRLFSKDPSSTDAIGALSVVATAHDLAKSWIANQLVTARPCVSCAHINFLQPHSAFLLSAFWCKGK